ncbi:MAG: AMP-binding protein, partial [Victivallales bacterium]|nr:AMP-binding protein [Victivallales bacterium]
MVDLLMKDFVDRRALEKIQLGRMKENLERVYARVPFYHKAFDEAGVKPSDLKCLADLAKFPFTLKKDLRENYPFGLVACDMKDITRIHASSGTTGKPTVVCYTKNDVDIWAETVCRVMQMAGLDEHDIVQVAYGYGLFTGGLGAHYGAEKLGAAVVPASGGATEKQIMLIKDLGVTAICCTPSFFMHIIEQADAMGIDLHDTKLRTGFFGAEPWTEEMRNVMIQRTGIRPHDIYGLSEIMGPGVSGSCE